MGWHKDSVAGRLRMTKDADKIRDLDSWPGLSLCMKSQPWITEATGSPRFGRIEEYDLTTIRLEGGGSKGYGSIEELVKEWSVD